MRPVNYPEAEGIRVALNWVRHCPDAFPEEDFWPAQKEKLPPRGMLKESPAQSASEPSDQASKGKSRESVWSGRLCRSAKSVEDALLKSGDM